MAHDPHKQANIRRAVIALGLLLAIGAAMWLFRRAGGLEFIGFVLAVGGLVYAIYDSQQAAKQLRAIADELKQETTDLKQETAHLKQEADELRRHTDAIKRLGTHTLAALSDLSYGRRVDVDYDALNELTRVITGEMKPNMGEIKASATGEVLAPSDKQ